MNAGLILGPIQPVNSVVVGHDAPVVWGAESDETPLSCAAIVPLLVLCEPRRDAHTTGIAPYNAGIKHMRQILNQPCEQRALPFV